MRLFSLFNASNSNNAPEKEPWDQLIDILTMHIKKHSQTQKFAASTLHVVYDLFGSTGIIKSHTNLYNHHLLTTALTLDPKNTELKARHDTLFRKHGLAKDLVRYEKQVPQVTKEKGITIKDRLSNIIYEMLAIYAPTHESQADLFKKFITSLIKHLNEGHLVSYLNRDLIQKLEALLTIPTNTNALIGF